MTVNVLAVSGLPTPNPRVMEQAVELLGAQGDDVYTLDPLPDALQADRSADIPAGVTDAAIEAYLRHAAGLFSEVGRLVVVNYDTEVLRHPATGQQTDLRISNSVGRIAFAVMQKTAPYLKPGDLQLTHGLPQRLGDASKPGLAVFTRTIEDTRLAPVRALRPRSLDGQINGTKLRNGSR